MNVSQLLEGTADAAFAVNQHGFIRAWNRAAEELFGYRAADVLETHCSDILRGRDSFANPVCGEECSILDCARSHHDLANYDLEVKVRSGRWLWVNVSILVSRDKGNDAQLVIHLVRDVASQKQAEALTQQLLEVAKKLTDVSAQSDASPPVSPLTDQERRVLQLLAAGKSASAVAQELSISSRTLRNHVHHVNEKLNTHNRLEAVMSAIRRDLLR
jgi:PAS domain S-box-containing protein